MVLVRLQANRAFARYFPAMPQLFWLVRSTALFLDSWLSCVVHPTFPFIARRE